MIPLLDGSPVFGSTCICQTPSAPRITDLTSTFGADGLEALDGGSRARITWISGTLWGPGPLGLGAAEMAVRSFNDGMPHIFTDTLGTEWPNVLLRRFQPTPPIMQSAQGFCGRRFTAQLLHLQ